LFASFLLSLVFGNENIQAQNPIPNPGFESWSNNEPVGWNTINQTILGTVFNPVTRDMQNPQEGLSSVKLETITKDILFIGPITMPGILTLGEIILDIQNMTGTVEGGIPISGFPDALKGWFRYLPAQDDSAIIGLGLTRWNGQSRDTVAYSYFTPGGQNPDWQQFTLPITYLLPFEPDTMNLIFVSSNLLSGTFISGSRLWIDNLWIEYNPASVNRIQDESTISIATHDNGKSLIVNTNGNHGELLIVNINGGSVFAKSVNNNSDNQQINLPALSPGIYLAHFTLGNGKIKKQKFVVSQ